MKSAIALAQRITLRFIHVIGQSCHMNSGIGHVTFFGQGDVSKCGAHRSLKSALALELVFSCCMLGILPASCDKSLG